MTIKVSTGDNILSTSLSIICILLFAAPNSISNCSSTNVSERPTLHICERECKTKPILNNPILESNFKIAQNYFKNLEVTASTIKPPCLCPLTTKAVDEKIKKGSKTFVASPNLKCIPQKFLIKDLYDNLINHTESPNKRHINFKFSRTGIMEKSKKNLKEIFDTEF